MIDLRDKKSTEKHRQEWLFLAALQLANNAEPALAKQWYTDAKIGDFSSKERRRFIREIKKSGDHVIAAEKAGITGDLAQWTNEVTSFYDGPSYLNRLRDLDYQTRILQKATDIFKAVDNDETDRAAVKAQEAAILPVPLTNHNESEPKYTTWADIYKMLGSVLWAWDPWLIVGMLAELVGEQGSGKSALALRIAGCYVEGWCWPDGTSFEGETGRVAWIETEASQQVNAERALSWGLDFEKILAPFDGLEDISLTNPEHKAEIERLAHLDDVRLIVCDSLSGGSAADENKSDMLLITGWLAALARDTGKPVLVVHHLRKRGLFDGDTIKLDRVRGSTAITQTARVVWALDTPDPHQDHVRRLQVIKSNLAAFPEPVGMTVGNKGIIFREAPEAPKPESVADKAADLLYSLLGSEPMPATEVRTEIEEAGISWVSAKRAKTRLGIVSIKKENRWYWGLPSVNEVQ